MQLASPGKWIWPTVMQLDTRSYRGPREPAGKHAPSGPTGPPTFPRKRPTQLRETFPQLINEDIDGWVVIGAAPGLRQLAFQRVAEWVPPRWPDPAYPQQLHLDIRVADAEQAEQELLALGATRVAGERETGFRVFTDPVGHPFCIVFGRHGPG